MVVEREEVEGEGFEAEIEISRSGLEVKTGRRAQEATRHASFSFLGKGHGRLEPDRE